MSHLLLPSEWSLSEGLELCRALQPFALKAGFAVGLCGSVLYQGESKKDLDVIVFPLGRETTEGPPLEPLYERLREFGMLRLRTKEQVKASWLEEFGTRDKKHVEIWFDDKGRRIDLFFLK